MTLIRIAMLALLSALLMEGHASAQLPVLQVSPSNNHYLQTAGGAPFFWMGDTAWKLYRLNPTELDQYFANRKSKGFNVIQGPTLLGSQPNYAGATNPNPASPNAAWFTHIDLIVSKAQEHGLYVVPTLAWGNQAGLFNQTTAYNWGFYVGNRYKNATNIAAYFVAGEFNHPDTNNAIWIKIAEGLQAGMAPNTRMISIHPRWYGVWGGQTSSERFHSAPWLAFNNIQSSIYGNCTNNPTHLYYLGTHSWLLVENDYELTPIKPVIDTEATYEMQSPTHPDCVNPEWWDDFGIRRRAYWSVFAGGFGHTYGCNGVYQFHKSYDPNTEWNPQDFWDVAIDYPGAFQMGYMRNLIESRPFFSRVPGQDFMISDTDILVPTHIHATRDSNGGYAMVYVPSVNRTITVDMDFISGATQRLWWFHPNTSQFTFIGLRDDGDYGANGSFTITTPNSGQDWVLVIDNASANYSPPGHIGPYSNGDATGDGNVDVDDLLLVINSWGPCAPPCAADLNFTEVADVDDLLAVINNWG